jgi:NarL family two-component system response regulator LiaR
MIKPVSLLLVDDNRAFLDVTSRFLGWEESVEIVGLAAGGKEGVEKAFALKPDVILIDLEMPDLPGLKAISLLRQGLPCSAIITLTLFRGTHHRQAALQAGADDLVYKLTMTQDLMPAIRRTIHARGAVSRFNGKADA